jgi:hypothetical protein
MSGILPSTHETDTYAGQYELMLEESPTRATITRRTRVRDASGGYRDTDTTLATSVPVLLYKPRATGARGEELSTDAGALTAAERWEAILPASASVLRSDRLTISGRTYEVIDTNDGETFDTARVVTLSRR